MVTGNALSSRGVGVRLIPGGLLRYQGQCGFEAVSQRFQVHGRRIRFRDQGKAPTVTRTSDQYGHATLRKAHYGRLAFGLPRRVTIAV